VTLREMALECLNGIDEDESGHDQIRMVESYLRRVEQAALEMAAKVADEVALGPKLDNRRAEDAAATYQSAACKVAWRIRELAKERAK
jgi:hypothetical protein